MSRVIKFRGKQIDTDTWVEGYYGYKELSDEHFIIVPTFDQHSDSMPQYFTDCLVHAASVGQYTGLQDRNGVQIYEGDILRIPDLYETPENTATTYHNDEVTFEDAAFCLGGEPLYEDHEYISDSCEVIGNIHEHPHLLKGE